MAVSKKSEGAPARKSGKAPAKENRRASPDVVEKRRAARRFNTALLGGAAPGVLDGRTEKRRQRLLRELTDGTARGSKRELKPVDVLSRVQALLDLGEPLASIRKACPARKRVELTDEVIDTVRGLHRAYGFAIEAYRFVGLDDDILRKAGVAGPGTRKAKPVLRPLATTRAQGPDAGAKKTPGRSARRGAA